MATSEDDDLRRRPLGELLSLLARDAGALVRRELDLLKAEAGDRGKKVAVAVAMLVVAAIVGLGAFGALTAFFVLLLDAVMPAWLAAIIVTGVYGLAAAVLVLRAKKLLTRDAMPLLPRTSEAIKEDVEWIKGQRRSAAT